MKRARIIFPLFLSLFLSIPSLTIAAAQKSYLDSTEINLSLLLPPPPSQTGPQTKAEIDEILGYQHTRTKAEADFAFADQQVSVFRFSDVLGPAFNKDSCPFADTFFKATLKDAGNVVEAGKEYWKRPRPYIWDTLDKPCVNKPPLSSFSYPSGHSAAGTLCAILLARMVPEKSAALFDRGWAFARNRVIGGVHYRSDIESGRIAGTLIAARMFESEAFRGDFARARAEIRRVLKYNDTSDKVTN